MDKNKIYPRSNDTPTAYLMTRETYGDIMVELAH